MDLSSILILAVILNLSIGVFVWRAQKKSWLNTSFGLMSILIGIWVLFNYIFELHPDIFLLKCTFAFGPFIVIFSFVWAHFITEKITSKNFKIAISLLFLSAILVSFWIFSNDVIKSVITPTNVVFDNTFNFFALYLGGLLVGFLIFLFVKFRKSSVEQKHKFLYVFIGLFLFAIAIIVFSLILPGLGYDRLSMLDSPCSIIFVGLTAYAILAKQLFDIRVVLTQTATGIVVLALLILTIISGSTKQGFADGTILVLVAYGGYLFNKSVLSDIIQKAQLKTVNKQLQKDKKDLQDLDRMKDEFLQMATHELNTPITVIQGKLSMAIDEDMCHLDKEQKDFLQPVLSDTMRLANLSKDILNVARIDQHRLVINPVETDIDALISQIVSGFEVKAKEKNNSIGYIRLSKELPKLKIDQSKIGEVITNLINNSNKFTENGKIAVTSNFKDGKVIISVADTGVGIDKEDQEHLFEKFYQAGRFDPNNPQEQQGSGLGLYISRNIIKLHGGDIWLESEKGKGSTFYFSLLKDYNGYKEPAKLHISDDKVRVL
jgi:signal transduction histidine kinase